MKKILALLACATAAEAIDIQVEFLMTVAASAQTSGASAKLSQTFRCSAKFSPASLNFYVTLVPASSCVDTVSGGGSSGGAQWTYASEFGQYPGNYGIGTITFVPPAAGAVGLLMFGAPITSAKAVGGNDTSGLRAVLIEAQDRVEADLKRNRFPYLEESSRRTPEGPYHKTYDVTVTRKSGSSSGEAAVHMEYDLYVGQLPPPKPVNPQVDDPCLSAGSIIGCQDQSLGQAVPVAGTPFRLHYRSDRTLGRLEGLPQWKAVGPGLGGWSLNVHHYYDPVGKALYLGDGSRRSGANVQPVPVAGGAVVMPGAGENLVYKFDVLGRHLSTLDEFTGAVVWEFQYDGGGRLAGIKDAYGNQTRLERVGELPSSLVGPYGHRTTLATDGNGYLVQIRQPDGASVRATYDNNGLMTSFIDARGNVSRFTYDSSGRLIRDDNAAGGYQTLTRTERAGGYDVQHRMSTGPTTTYSVTVDTSGNVSSKTQFTGGATGESARTNSLPGSAREAAGTAMSVSYAADPRWGTQAATPSSVTFTTPGGISTALKLERSVELREASNPLSLSVLRETLQVNGRPLKREYSAATRTFTTTSPSGKSSTRRLDANGREVELRASGLAPVFRTYDNRGRLTRVTAGEGAEARATSIEYGEDGLPQRATDPAGRVFRFSYDQVGRLVRTTRPDGQVEEYTYDAAGNVVSMVPPGRPAHRFEYTALDLGSSYAPPAVSGADQPVTFSWNADGDPIGLVRADGAAIQRSYDDAGRLSALEYPGGKIRYAYDEKNNRLTSLTDADGNSVSFAYDGALLVAATWAGLINGSVRMTYNANLGVASMAAGGADPIAFLYNEDGHLVSAGDLRLGLDPASSLIAATALDQVSDARTWNSFGELTGYRAEGPAGTLLEAKYTRDKLGRITEKAETVAGRSSNAKYSYDAAGRLVSADRDGAVTTYSYDANGNRTRVASSAGSEEAIFDEQDRMLQRGAATYRYSADGELIEKTAAGQTTQYEYDAVGHLRRVVLPDGREIRYVADGEHRRIGKLVNGALVQGFLWQGATRPAAELDGAGNLVSVFVYASVGGAPAYLVKQGVTYRILTDQLGSPRLVVNAATGEVAQQIEYGAFGEVTADTNPGFQPFGFAGGLYDPDTGLVRFYARDYDAEAGRWTAKDPVRFAGGDTNLYAYLGNDPVNLRDPFGLAAAAQSVAKGVNTAATEQLNLGGEAKETLDIVQQVINAWEAVKRVPGKVGDWVEKKLMNTTSEVEQIYDKITHKGKQGAESLSKALKEAIDTAVNFGQCEEPKASKKRKAPSWFQEERESRPEPVKPKKKPKGPWGSPEPWDVGDWTNSGCLNCDVVY